MAFFILTRHELLFQEAFRSKFGAFYEDFKIHDKRALLYYSVFVIRRYLMALTCVFLTDHPIFQIQMYAFYTLFYLWYLVSVRPFNNELNNRLEILNEFVVLGTSYLLFIFSDFVDDPGLKFKCGMAFIAILAFIVVTNIGTSVLVSLLNIF